MQVKREHRAQQSLWSSPFLPLACISCSGGTPGSLVGWLIRSLIHLFLVDVSISLLGLAHSTRPQHQTHGALVQRYFGGVQPVNPPFNYLISDRAENDLFCNITVKDAAVHLAYHFSGRVRVAPRSRTWHVRRGCDSVMKCRRALPAS